MQTVFRRLVVVVCLSLGLVSFAEARADESKSTRTAAQSSPPNILLIFADDLGWKDVGYQGSSFCQTPQIDRLAAEGMVFTNAYSAAGNCAPSRACLLSGQYTPRHHVYAVGSTKRGQKSLMRLEPVPNKSGLAPRVVTMAEALKQRGYATGLFGKWHLHGPDGAPPEDQGFDVYFDKQRPNPNKTRGDNADPKGIFSLTKAACEFMEQQQDRPFFCYLAHHAIHSALDARPETLRKFRALPELSRSQARYAACTSDLDAGVGEVLKFLETRGLAKNTLVVFTSDNGATPQSPQEPLRGNKGGYYEGGIREPLIVRWPGRVAAGTQCDEPVILVDLFPTFLAVASGQTSGRETARQSSSENSSPSDPQTSQLVLDGESLLPLLTESGKLQRKAIYWHFPGYLNQPVIRGRDRVFRTRPVSVIRKGQWKLLLYHEEWLLDGGADKLDTNRTVELYHLASDIGERVDLSQVNPRRRDELLRDLQTWWKQTAAPLPTPPTRQR